MRGKQKKLVEGMRENVQLLQSQLQEAENIGSEFHGANQDKSKAR
jgi:hypothetical protein